MLIRAFVVLGLVLISGCVTLPQIRLPNTESAMACSRQCMFLSQSCSANVTSIYGVTGGNAYTTMTAQNQCAVQQRECLLTCPGACQQQDPNGGCYDAMGRNMLVAPAVASQAQ